MDTKKAHVDLADKIATCISKIDFVIDSLSQPTLKVFDFSKSGQNGICQILGEVSEELNKIVKGAN